MASRAQPISKPTILSSHNLSIFNGRHSNSQSAGNEQNLNPNLSPNTNESISSDSNHEVSNHQEICRECNQWASNSNDYKFNFVNCSQPHCINSYHRQCVDSSSFHSCSQINRQCNTIHLRTYKFIQDPYHSRFYTYSKHRKVFVDHKQAKNSPKRFHKRFVLHQYFRSNNHFSKIIPFF